MAKVSAWDEHIINDGIQQAIFEEKLTELRDKQNRIEYTINGMDSKLDKILLK